MTKKIVTTDEIYKDKYRVEATWVKGIVGWLIANTEGDYGWFHTKDSRLMWWFDNGTDAIVFRLKYGDNQDIYHDG